jgi:hypothetical protein
MVRALVVLFVLGCVAVSAAGVAAARAKPLPPITLAAPPFGFQPAALALLDTVIAISRAEATYPEGAARAATLYAAAMERYGAGDLAAVEAKVLQAIAATSHSPYPEPQAWTSPAPTIAAIAPQPDLIAPDQGEAESYLGLAWRALGRCGATDPALLQDLSGRYGAAVQELLQHRWADVVADAHVIVDGCVLRVPTPSPSPR